jgi:hypothetical protein
VGVEVACYTGVLMEPAEDFRIISMVSTLLMIFFSFLTFLVVDGYFLSI